MGPRTVRTLATASYVPRPVGRDPAYVIAVLIAISVPGSPVFGDAGLYSTAVRVGNSNFQECPSGRVQAAGT